MNSDNSYQPYLVDPLLVQATQWQESRNNPDAVSPKGAVGQMQTMPATLTSPGYGVRPAQNNSREEQKRVGDEYLQAMHNKYQDQNLALMAYNWGPGHVDTWLEKGAPSEQVPAETKDYVENINQTYHKLKSGQMAQNEVEDPDLAMVRNFNARGQAAPDPEVDPDLELVKGYKYTAPTIPSASSPAPMEHPQELPLSTQIATDVLHNPSSYTPLGLERKLGNAMWDTAKGGFNDLGKLIDESYKGYSTGDFTSPPTPETLALQNKLRDGTATRQDKEAAFLSEVSNSPGGHFSGAIAGLAPGLNLGTTLFNKLVNPAIQESTGVSPEDLQTGELLGGTALGTRHASEFAGKTPSIARPAANLVNELTGRAAEKSPDEIIRGFSNSGDPPDDGGGGGGGGGPISPHLINNAISPIPGVTRTLAQATGDSGLAQLERTMETKDTGPITALREANDKARKEYFKNLAGTPEDITAKEAEREAVTKPLYETARTQPLNPDPIHPILEKIDQKIEEVGESSDAGKRLVELREKIKGALPVAGTSGAGILDASGKLVPAKKAKNQTQSPLIQIYREERDQLAKTADKEGAYGNTVATAIQPIWHDLGVAIESQSPPFAKAQQTYRETSPAIEAARYLQGLRLTDASGRMTLGSVNNIAEGLPKLLNSAPSYHAVRSLSPEQIQGIMNLREDLRTDAISGKGKAFGSNSAQNVEAANKLNKLYPGTGIQTNRFTPEGIGATLGAGVGGYLFGGGGAAAGAYLGGSVGHSVGKVVDVRRENALTTLNKNMMDAQAYKNMLLQKLQEQQ